MRAAMAAVLALCILPASAQVTFQKWQDMGAYVGRQTEKLNTHTEQIQSLLDRVAALEAKQVKDRDNIQALIAHSDIMVRYAVELECAANKNMPSVLGVFSWFRPFELGSIECPPAGQRYYLPYYLSPSGPILPSAQ